MGMVQGRHAALFFFALVALADSSGMLIILQAIFMAACLEIVYRSCRWLLLAERRGAGPIG